MPILKNLTFTSLPARSQDPMEHRRSKLIERLEEQKRLLADPSTSGGSSAGPARATTGDRSRSSSG